MNITQHTTNRFRKIDLLAFAGAMTLSGGWALFTFGPDYPRFLPLWMLAPLLWWLGCGLLIAWALIRMLVSVAPGDGDESKMRQWLREKLIETAGKVFAEVGFDGATVRKICSRAGIDVNAVDEHFGDKLGLYTEVLNSSIMAQQEPAHAMSAAHASDPRLALRALICEWFERAREGGRPDWFAPIMAREMARPTLALDRVADTMGSNYLRFRSLVGQVIERGPDDPATRMCVHSVVGQVLHYMQSRAMLTRLWPNLNLDNQDQRHAIADHIVTFSLAGMDRIAQQQPEPIGKD